MKANNLPWFEVGVLVVALLLSAFVVANYAHASPGYGPPEGWDRYNIRHGRVAPTSELGPDVQPCEINLATGENCFGEKVIPVDAPLPLSPHNHLPCTDSVSAGASLLAGENEEEVYDLGCKSKRK